MTDVNGNSFEAWQVYGLCNPTKSAAQVDAWRRKHHPAADSAPTQGNP